MAADITPANSLASGGRGRSVTPGDIPEALRRHYVVEERSAGGLAVIPMEPGRMASFADEGRQLVADRADPLTIRDMLLVAQHRGWTITMARGATAFRREAWLAGRAMGLEVRGYRPTERDVEALDRRIDRRLAREAATPDRRDHREGPGARDKTKDPPEIDAAAQSRLRLVEAVVRARVPDRAEQDRILAAARGRIATWLEKGAHFRPLQPREQAIILDLAQARERGR